MAAGCVVLPTSGHAACDDRTSWWLSRYKVSTQQACATYLPRWTNWCADHGLDPFVARRADVELWLHAITDSGLSRASIARHYDGVASIHRLAFAESLLPANPCARIDRPRVLRPPGAGGRSGRKRCAGPSAPWGSISAFACATSSARCATPARRPHATHQVAGFLAGWAN